MFCDYTQSDLDKVIALLLASEELRFSGLMNRDLPNQGGIYRIYNFLEENKYSLYVGKGEQIRRRLYSNHFNGPIKNSTLRRKLLRSGFADEAGITEYLQSSCKAQYIVIEDERFRCFAEHYAIAVFQPKYND